MAIFVGTRLLFPEHPLAAWFATLLTAGMPEFLFMAGSVNNDNMITLLSTWSLVLMLQLLRTGLRWWQPLALGLLSGLAALTKASGLLLLPLACLSIGVAYWQSHTPKQVQLMKTLKSLAPHWGSAIAIFMLVAGWWFARNWQLYGDPSGTLGHLAVMPVRDTMTLSIFFQELPGLFLSWWGVFGCTMPPSYFYLIAGALTLGGLLGSLLGREELKSQRIPLFVLLIWFGLMWAAYLQWNWVIHAAKGRLLYPTLLAWNGLLGWGWAYWANRQHWVKTVLPGGLLLCAILIPLGVMAPRVTPPPIITQDVKLVISHPIEGSFGDAIALRGYALNQTSFEPGQQLDLALYWEAKGQPDQHYSLAIQLVSAIPGETSALLNFNTWPGGGNYPTGYWKTGEIIEDRYQLRLPDTVAQAQAWILQIIIYETESGARLPWNLQGQSIENHAKLSLVRVGASHQMTPPTDSVAAPVIFQNAIRLNAIAIKPIADQLRVELWWESLAPLPTDYTVFVHLLDAAGNPLTQADGPPLAGGFPTSFWHPGDTVHDVYILQQPDTGTSQTLKLGWYDPQNGTRLEAVQNGEILPEAALTLTVPATP
ncbi:MAG: hypothetical protein BWY63_03043 [Chloroflexi bacterium ADurb.Bin360]|nr:MAG: hypothetical protein BWY63_03043 [Chloroflexi bacterium ADurb.Bin360]